MQKQFVTYEIALKLKELGFDEECLGEFWELGRSYNTGKETDVRYGSILNHIKFHAVNPRENEIPTKKLYNAPLWQQVIDWFREEHKILVNPINSYKGVYYWVVVNDVNEFNVETEDIKGTTWCEAREKAILAAIELINKK